MPLAYDPVRIETLLALSLSGRWSPRHELPSEPDTQEESEVVDEAVPVDERVANADSNGDLPAPLQGLTGSDRRAVKLLLQSYEKLSSEDQLRWLAHRMARVRSVSRERNRRFDKDIHTSQIVEALRDEPPLIQSIIASSLPSSHKEAVAEALGLELSDLLPESSLDHAAESKIVDVVRQGFLERFVATDTLKNATPFDLLSVVELARLIRFLGVRETAIACQGITAVEAVTAFLKRFSAEDAHAIVSHISALKTVDQNRIEFAEQLVRRAINAGSNAAAAMLDRVGLALLAIVLETRGQLRRRHIAQKLSIQAARELGQLMSETGTVCDAGMARRVLEEAESLAVRLHHLPSECHEERRGMLSLKLVNE